VAGASRPNDLEGMLRAAGFTDVAIEQKAASKEYIKDWLPGSGAEDYVVSANVTARKPGCTTAPKRAKEPEVMPARMRKALEAKQRAEAARKA